jgi:hypothetical protein
VITLRTLVLVAQGLVILTIGMVGAALVDSVFTANQTIASRVCCIIRSTP